MKGHAPELSIRFALAGAALMALGGCSLIDWGDYRVGGEGGGASSASTGVGGSGGGSSSSSSGGGGGAGGGDAGVPLLWPDSATAFCVDLKKAVACPTSAASTSHGQDGDYAINVPSYTLTGQGADPELIDSVTGLTWEADFGAVADVSVTWAGALDHCQKLNQKVYGGLTDWRLPSRRELATLIDAGHTLLGGLLSPFFPKELDQLLSNNQNAYYLTSSVFAGDASSVWAFRLLPKSDATLTALKAQAGEDGAG